MKTNILLAPLSGITDLSFRLISREFGAKFCFFEMVDANGLSRDHRTSVRLLKTLPKDKPIAAQLVGGDPAVMREAAQKLLDLTDVSFLDLNCACPAKKVIKKNAGAHLLRDPERFKKILKVLTSSVPLPITVKMRLGFDEKDRKESVDFAKRCEEYGASRIFVHGRTREDGYSGEVDYSAIKSIKKALKIPVFGSGNIFNPIMAKKMFDKTNCDGILVARGALGNPWIFKNIENYLAKDTLLEKPTLAIRKKILKKHLSYIRKYKDLRPVHQVGYMRKVAMWYMKGVKNATKIRADICRTKRFNELIRLINRSGA